MAFTRSFPQGFPQKLWIIGNKVARDAGNLT